jgi:hypothetical protein
MLLLGFREFRRVAGALWQDQIATIEEARMELEPAGVSAHADRRRSGSNRRAHRRAVHSRTTGD